MTLGTAGSRSSKAAKAQKGMDLINKLPDELLIKILQCLGKTVPEEYEEDDRNPYRVVDTPHEPHPGLRSYPFLGQVCKHWKELLDRQDTCNLLWPEVVVDFNHELITAVHTPIMWSDERPGNAEFEASFSRAKLDSSRILAFIAKRRANVKRIVMMNSEGYVDEESKYVDMVSKHDFSKVTFGMMCGMLYDTLEELVILHCSDWFQADSGVFGAISCLKKLKCLRIEASEEFRLDLPQMADRLSSLTLLTQLSLEKTCQATPTGLLSIPASWAALTALQVLCIPGHAQLRELPSWIGDLPLTQLDLTYCKAADVQHLTGLTRLQNLSLQGLSLTDARPSQAQGNPAAPQSLAWRIPRLPDLSDLQQLEGLNLAENNLLHMPPVLSKLTKLRFLDLSCNKNLTVPKSLKSLTGLLKLERVDMRYVHQEADQFGTPAPCWSMEKGATMTNITLWGKQLRNKGSSVKVLVGDTDGAAHF